MPPRGAVGEQQLRQLVAHALGRDAVDLGRELGHRGARAPPRPRSRAGPRTGRRAASAAGRRRRTARERPGCAGVFASRSSTPPDGSTSVELRQPQRERVHREVAAREVVLEAGAEHDLGLAGVAVVAVGAVGGDLDGLAGDLRADRAERAADVPVRLGDRLHDREDLVGRGIRREVEVVGAAAEERVAHRAADEGELVARRLERRGQRRDGRRSRQLAQPVEGRRDTLHAPYVKRARRGRSARADRGPACGRRADAPGPRRRIACMVAESNPARRRADSSTRRDARPRPLRVSRASAAALLVAARRDAPLAANARRSTAAAASCGRLPGGAPTTRASVDAGGGMSRAGGPCRPSTSRRQRAARAGRADDRHHHLARRARRHLRSRSRTPRARPSPPASCDSCRSRDADRRHGRARRLARRRTPTTAAGIESEAAIDGVDVAEASREPSPPGAVDGRVVHVPARRSPSSTTRRSSASVPNSSSATRSSPPAPTPSRTRTPGPGSVAVAPRRPAHRAPAAAPRPHRAPTSSRTGRVPPACSRASSTPSSGGASRSASTRASSRRSGCSARRRPAIRDRVARSASPGCRTRYSRSRTPTPTSPCRRSSACPRCSRRRRSPTCSTRRTSPPADGDGTTAARRPAATPPDRRPPCRARADARRGADDRGNCSTGRTRAPTSPGRPTTRSRPATSRLLRRGRAHDAILAPGNVEPVDGSANAASTRSTARRRSWPTPASPRRCARHPRPHRHRVAAGGGPARRTRLLDAGRRGAPDDRARHVRPRRAARSPAGWPRSSTRSPDRAGLVAGLLSDAIGAPPTARTLVDQPETDERVANVGRMRRRPRRTSPSSRRCSTTPAAHRADAARAPRAARRGMARRSRRVERRGRRLARHPAAERSERSRSCRAARSTWSRPRPACPTTIAERAAVPGDRRRRRRPVERPPHRRGPGRGHRRARIAQHGRACRSRPASATARSSLDGVADSSRRVCRSATPSIDPRQRAGRLGGPRRGHPRRDRRARVRHRHLAQHPSPSRQRAARCRGRAARDGRRRTRTRRRREPGDAMPTAPDRRPPPRIADRARRRCRRCTAGDRAHDRRTRRTPRDG